MKGAGHVLAATARLYGPLAVLLALVLLSMAPAGRGVGLTAGLLAGLALVLHALVFGVAASKAALPPTLARVLIGLGLVAAVSGPGLPRFAYAPQLLEGGLAVLTASGAALLVQVLFGRVPTLREAELR